MNHIQKLRNRSFLKWVLLNLTDSNLRSSKTTLWPTGFYHIGPNPRFYRRKASLESKNGQKVNELSYSARREAQAALVEYLHYTRSLQYVDAENISRNSPQFLEKLLKGVNNEEDIKQSVTRFLRYHPINEFEPFFESMGLNSSEYSPFLPRNLMYLSDDEVLLENYHVLCEYGISPNKIGKIYKEAKEAFRYEHGLLLSKLHSLQEVGFNQSSVVKFVVSCPYLLTGDVIRDFLKVLEELKSVGIMHGWIEDHLSEENSYNWSHMLELLNLFSKLGLSKEQVGGLLCNHPALLLEDSGSTAITLIGFLLKFGASADDIISMFFQFPHIQIRKYVFNLRQCYHFLTEIEMDAQDIATIVCGYPVLLGQCSLKKVKSLLNGLNCGKKRLCEIIKKTPQELKNWVLGSKVKPLPTPIKEIFLEKKVEFLLDLGFVENSGEMEKALKLFRGKGGELKERFDCLVNAGLSRKDVSEMVKMAPQVINQTKEVIEMKIDFLVNGLGYPVSSLVAYPGYLSYTTQKVKLRFSMYNWLKDQGTMSGKLALSTVLACSDRKFISEKVNRHPEGPEVWEKLRKQLYCD